MAEKEPNKTNEAGAEAPAFTVTEMETLKEELFQAYEIIDELKALSKMPKLKGTNVTFKGKQFMIGGSIRLKGRVISPEEISADKTLLAKLIENKSYLIKEVKS